MEPLDDLLQKDRRLARNWNLASWSHVPLIPREEIRKEIESTNIRLSTIIENVMDYQDAHHLPVPAEIKRIYLYKAFSARAALEDFMKWLGSEEGKSFAVHVNASVHVCKADRR